MMSASLRVPLAICLGAIPGALSRYYLTLWFAQWLGTAFPFGTFAINITGAFMMGGFAAISSLWFNFPADLRPLVATGFLGSYTTFSTYALDTADLMREGRVGIAGFYWLGSAVLGYLALESGSFLTRRFLGPL